MAIIYPRDMPSTRVRSIVFEAEPQEAFAPEQGGRFVSVQLGPALWRMQLQTTPPSELEFSLWRAWLDTLEGGAKEFFGYDVRRPMPWNYRGGYAGLTVGAGTAFIGSAFGDGINAARDEITVSTNPTVNLPVGFQFETGDYCSIRFSPGGGGSGGMLRSLHRIVDRPAAADSNGSTLLTVRPSVHASVVFPSALLHFGNTATAQRAACLMRVTRRDRSAEHKSRSISFEAVQSLRFK